MMQILRSASIAAAAVVFLATGCSKDSTETPSDPGTNPDATSFTITFNEIAPTTVIATFTPTDPTAHYATYVLRQIDYKDKYNSNISKLLSSYVAKIMEEEKEATLASIYAEYFAPGEFRGFFDNLPEDTDCLAIAVAVNDQCKPIGEPVIAEFTTKSVTKYDCTFDITVSDVSLTRAKFKFEPSNKNIQYLSGVILEAQYPLDAATQAEFAQVLAAKWIDEAAAAYSIYRLDAIPYISISGDQEKDLQKGALQPNIEYLAITVGIDPSGIITTAPSVKLFKTKPANTSSNTFAVDIDKTPIGASITVTPTNSDSYYARVFTAASLEGVSDDVIVASLANQGAANELLSGTQTIDTWKEDLVPDTDYTLVIYGCDEWATTPVRRIAFTTEESGNPAQCNFTFESSIKNITIDYSVIPSDNTVMYYSEIMKSSLLPVSDKAVIDDINIQMEEILESEPNLLPGEVLLLIADRGRRDSKYNVYPGKYTLFAVPLDSKTGKVAGTKVSRKEITVSARTVSNAAITVSGKKHYDGDALAAHDPITYKEYLDIPDHAHGVMSLTPNSDAKKWYISVFNGDLTDKSIYSDEAIITNTTGYGAQPTTNQTFTSVLGYKDNDLANTICIVAEDANGIFGIVGRELWEPEKSGASPISELVGGPKGANVRIPYRLAEPEMTPETTFQQRFEQAKASGALNRINASKAAKAEKSTSATDFVQHEVGQSVGFIR